MFNLHSKKRLLDRIRTDVQVAVDGTTIRGDWNATALFWKPQLGLLVNERIRVGFARSRVLLDFLRVTLQKIRLFLVSVTQS